MKKVVMITRPIHPVPPRKGAAVEWWMVQVAKRMRSYEPHIISIRAEGYAAYEHTEGVHFHRISIGRMYKRCFNKWLGIDPYSYAARVARLAGRIAPDILHFLNAHELLNDVSGLLSIKPKVISHLQNEYPIKLVGGVDMIITCSDYLTRLYRTRLQDRVDTRTVYNGVDAALYGKLREEREGAASLKSELGIPAHGKVVLFVGRISPEKGPHLLVEAFSRLMPSNHDAYLLLVGEVRLAPKGKDDQRYAYGQRILRDCERLGNRMICAGSVSPERMPSYYGLADVAVFPSVFEEPFGMVAVEAMAAGLPVIVSEKGGFREYVVDGVNGLFIDGSRPVEDISEKVRRILEDSELAARLGRAGRRTVEERFTWERIAEETQQAYADMMVG